VQFPLNDYLWQLDSFVLLNNNRTYFSKETHFVFESIEIEPDVGSLRKIYFFMFFLKTFSKCCVAFICTDLPEGRK
jgi:hypothetical protein